MRHEQPDDLEIIRAQKKRGRYLEIILEKTSPYVLSLCLMWCRPPIDPQDITQDSLIRIAKNINSYEHKSAFFSWVYSIVYRTFLDALRKQNRRNKIVKFESLSSVEQQSNEAHNEADDELDILAQCLKELDPLWRDILILIDVQEIPYTEVADMLDIPIGTVRSRIARARLRLKKLLESKGTFSRADAVKHNEERK